MPPKKKGGKKKKEVEPITDPKMLRLIGEHLEGSTLNLTLSFEVANGPVQVKVILSEMDCVHHLYRELWRWMDCPWGKEYIFITTLPKTEQNSFTLAFDGGKGLTDIGLKDGDSLVFIEASKRAIGEYTKKRLAIKLDHLLMKLSEEKAELLIAKKDKKHPDDIAALEKNVAYLDGEVDKYREYAADHEKAYAELATFSIGEKPASIKVDKKPFSELPIEIKQELENTKKEAMDILQNNRAIIAAAKAKAEGKGKGKGGKKKKK